VALEVAGGMVAACVGAPPVGAATLGRWVVVPPPPQAASRRTPATPKAAERRIERCIPESSFEDEMTGFRSPFLKLFLLHS
jgi:hypothetical protein